MTDLIKESKKKVDPSMLASEQFAHVFQAYLECSNEVQGVIRDMVSIVNDPEAENDEIEAAVSTISEALFSSAINGVLGVDLEECEKMQPSDVQQVLAELDEEERHFADRVAALMAAKSMSQSDLAAAINVGQPAISMMLNRTSRPQRRTVEKIAQALGVEPQELWPTKEG